MFALSDLTASDLIAHHGVQDVADGVEGTRFRQTPPRASLTALAYLRHRWAMKRPQDGPEHSKLYFWNTGCGVIR
jgi:hypothetical protein